MSKKLRPVSEVAPNQQKEMTTIEPKHEADGQQQIAEACIDPASTTFRALHDDAHQKQIDELTQQNSMLLKEKDELTERMAQMIEELQQLRSQTQGAGKEQDSLVNKLKKDNQELQDAYDAILVRLSDLSFENAKLICQLNECNNQKASNRLNDNGQTGSGIRTTTSSPKTIADAPRVVSNGAYLNNGYDSWN